MTNSTILDAIFSKVFDPVAVYHVIGGGGEPVDLVYDMVNDAYVELNNIPREKLTGRRYTDVCASETYKNWMELMLQVAETGHAGYCEGKSDMNPGYFHLLAFSPVQGQVVAIFRDMTEWHKSETELAENRELLRKLTARLTLAEERTRRDIANTLHDSVGYSMVMMLNSLRSLHETVDGADARAKAAETIREMESLIDRTRSFTFEISPPLLYEVGLDATIEACCNQIFASHDVRCSFQSEGEVTPLAEDTKILLYQMAHELLLNAVKHAKAGNVFVRIRWGTRKVQILIEDDGIGFDQSEEKAPTTTSGMGLFSIRERMSSIGGQFNIISEPGEGTTASLIAPTLAAEKHQK